MTHQNNLIGKYYRGESSLEEERELQDLLLDNDTITSEQDMFAFFNKEATIPEGLEDDLFAGIQQRNIKKKTIRRKMYSMVSAAAVVLILLTVFLDVRNNKRIQMEDDFFVMEQALFQISESLQLPQEQEEMLVLWVDDDVEIIIN